MIPEGVLFRVERDKTSIVQEVTMTVGQSVAKLAEEKLFRVEGARRPKRDGTALKSKPRKS